MHYKQKLSKQQFSVRGIATINKISILYVVVNNIKVFSCHVNELLKPETLPLYPV